MDYLLPNVSNTVVTCASSPFISFGFSMGRVYHANDESFNRDDDVGPLTMLHGPKLTWETRRDVVESLSSDNVSKKSAKKRYASFLFIKEKASTYMRGATFLY